MKRAGLVVCLLFFSALLNAQTSSKSPEGVLPLGIDGKPLNLDFETGTLKDWIAEGKAFDNQPIKGDTVHLRRADMKSQHQGDYWIGGYERLQDKPQGTLTSVPFKVTHPWASFLVAGGPWQETCVELVRKDSGQVFLRSSGSEEENLRRVVVDLSSHQDKEMFIRIVDRHSGHWGHINFDDFRFHAEKPNFPTQAQGPRPLGKGDTFKYAGLPPDKAAQAMTVPEGFEVKLFAGEPDVHQPIAFCIDDRGRLWVAEAYVYPKRLPPMGTLLPEKLKAQGDRILILEDSNGDGKFDKKTLFMEGLNLISGIEVGFGGVWIGAAPYLMYVPIKDGEDKPAGEPKILLDGWGWQDTHETLNSFIWGPDGWLYGCHGVFTHSKVGKPGTPDAQRTAINAGIWRYHPTKHIFEVFAHGTSNPWGLDFNDRGQAFCEACVIPHAFHIIQDARYHRQAGTHFNPHTYADIQTIADHRHYLGATPHGGNNKSDSAGGGHAHCGTMIYLGGAWPAKYRDQWFMGNIHGRRINMDMLLPKGSGYVAAHGPDFLMANDEYARFINMQYGPDGNVYLIDWYDKQACHNNNPQIWDRTNGRIYKICYRGSKSGESFEGLDLRKLSDLELVKLQLHENDWFVRHARRILQERKEIAPEAVKELEGILAGNDNPVRRLRALWTLHCSSSLDFDHVAKALDDKDAYVRGWAIQLAMEDWGKRPIPTDKLAELAASDESPVVRRYLASALPRLGFPERERVLESLLGWEDDAKDHNLPLLYWYGLEPLAGNSNHGPKAIEMALQTKMPNLLAFAIRRAASDSQILYRPGSKHNPLKDALENSTNPATQLAILRGLNEAAKQPELEGIRTLLGLLSRSLGQLRKSTDPEIRSLARTLAVAGRDGEAVAETRNVLVGKGDTAQRVQALQALLGIRDPELPGTLHQLVADPALRSPALRALAQYVDPKTPEVILGAYARFSLAEKRDALGTLASRAPYAHDLLKAVAAKQVASADIPADIVRQLRTFKDAELDRKITEVWGSVRETAADKAKLMDQYRKQLAKPPRVPPDLALGRAIFTKTCAQCHMLFGAGGKIGPDITGSNRADINYLLENLLDPSAVVQKEYAVSHIETTNGRVLQGIVKELSEASVTLVMANETIILPRKEIDSLKLTDKSMMPDDQLKPLNIDELRSLIAYLQSPTQTPMLLTAENAKDFFNGKDLTNWEGDAKLWSVDNGEIVGKSPGLKQNEFLRSHFTAGDFKLTLKVKLVPNSGNSGIQFRSQALPGGEMKGLQADIGAGWWGKLYDEHGRALLWPKSGEEYVKLNDWNDYEVVAEGTKIRTFINGKACVDFEDTVGPRRGIFALQIHSGPAMEVRFKDLRVEVK